MDRLFCSTFLISSELFGYGLDEIACLIFVQVVAIYEDIQKLLITSAKMFLWQYAEITAKIKYVLAQAFCKANRYSITNLKGYMLIGAMKNITVGKCLKGGGFA